LNESAIGSAIIMIIVACASFFAWFCTTEGIAEMVSQFLIDTSGNKITFLLLMNAILLIAGCFLDAISALYIFTPILLPVAIKFGYDPVVLGVVMTVNLAIGMITPPVGVNLYVACGVSKISLKEISMSVLPFLFATVTALLLITYIPQITLFLPDIMGIK